MFCIMPLGNTSHAQAKTKICLSQNMKKINKEYLKSFNKYRKENDLNKLKNNNNLVSAARVRAKELVIDFSHTRPMNKSLINLCDKKGAKKYRYYGEIIAKLCCKKSDIAKNTRKLALMTIYDGWRNSPSHSEAIKNSKYTFCGTSYYFKDGKLYVCTIFAGY